LGDGAKKRKIDYDDEHEHEKENDGVKSRLTILLLVVLGIVNLGPLIYMLWLGSHETAAGGETAWLEPWRRLWGSAPLMGRWLFNSGVVAGVTVGYHVIADAMAGWVLARRRFRGRALVFGLIVVAMMVPRQVTLIPLFLGMARAGLADTLAGLILPGLGDVVGIFLMRQFFITMPEELLEAARIEGAGEWTLFWRIGMPLARPALGVLAVLAFTHYWGDFFWPLVITQSPETYTVQVGLAYLAQSEFGRDLPLLAAGATAAAVPILAVFVAVRRQFFEGMRAGALRG
jgi:ABC-type glycerol-3-phosphate transport system permease component